MARSSCEPITLRVSDVVHFDGCKRAWWLGHTWETGHFSEALFTGTGIHAGLQGYYLDDRDIEMAHAAIDHWSKKERARWNYTQSWDEAEGDRIIDEIHQYLDHYALFDAEHPLTGTILSDDKGLIVERRMRCEILGPDGTPLRDSRGLPVYLTGQCDLGLRKGPDTIGIVDHKSFSTRTMADNPEAGLEVDDQGTAYVYLFWRTYGVLPASFTYNVFVKQHPVPPRMLNNGTLSKAKDQYTTAALYRNAVKEAELSITPYLDIIDHLERQGYGRYFQRWQSSRNMQEIRAFERRLAFKTQDIVRLVENPDDWAYPSGSSYRCGRCAFIAPCKASDDGGDALAVLENEFQPKELWRIND